MTVATQKSWQALYTDSAVIAPYPTVDVLFHIHPFIVEPDEDKPFYVWHWGDVTEFREFCRNIRPDSSIAETPTACGHARIFWH